MKLAGPEASRYLTRPDPAKAGLLISGADPMAVALRRKEAISALAGPGAEEEMRLARLAAADLRKDAARLFDEIKAVGFFPGPRVVFLEDATDGLTETVAAALRAWAPGDASLVVTANQLTPKSTLKALFEKAPNAVSITLYDDPPSREEVMALLAKAGLDRVDPQAMAEITNLSRALDPGDFRQTIEKIGLYKHGDETPLTVAEITALAPGAGETDVLDVVAAAVEGRKAELGLLMRRIEAQGVAPVTLCIQAQRYLRALHVAASDPGGVAAGIGRSFGFGNRRGAMQTQAGRWGMARLETAMALMVETDLTLRSSSRAPAMALVERALLKIAYQAPG